MVVAEAELTPDQIARWKADGYLLVPDLLTPAEVDAFLEAERQPKLPEQQLGLRSHTIDGQWRYVATHPRVLPIVRQLLGGRPRIVQTMFLHKAPGGGRGIALHQDTHYLPTEPNTLMACWIALADADESNGTLCVVPGSHKGGLRNAARNQSAEHDSWESAHTMRDRSGKEWRQNLVSFQISDVDPASIVKLAVPRGAGVFFTGMTIHGSFANHSSNRPRPAFATHYVHEDTWVLRTDVQDAVLV